MASLHVMGQLNQDSTHADDGGSRPYTRLAQKSKVDVHNIPGPARVGLAFGVNTDFPKFESKFACARSARKSSKKCLPESGQ